MRLIMYMPPMPSGIISPSPPSDRLYFLPEPGRPDHSELLRTGPPNMGGIWSTHSWPVRRHLVGKVSGNARAMTESKGEGCKPLARTVTVASHLSRVGWDVSCVRIKFKKNQQRGARDLNVGTSHACASGRDTNWSFLSAHRREALD